MMRNVDFRNWGVLMLAVMLVAAVGCAKKGVVRSAEAPGAEAAPPAAMEEGIVTETVEPGVKEEEAVTAMAPPGIAATMERPSRFQDIHFDYDKSFIREDAKPVLTAIAEQMNNSPSALLLIEGHCDERGTAEYNMALGERRAEAAKRYLVSLGVREGAITTVSFGEEKPLDPGHNDEAWAKNRRAHFVLQ